MADRTKNTHALHLSQPPDPAPTHGGGEARDPGAVSFSAPTIVRQFLGRRNPESVPSPDLASRDVPPTESERDRIERIARVFGVPDATEDEIAESVNVLRRDSISRKEHEDAITLERFLHECQLGMRESALWKSNERRGWLAQIQRERDRRTQAERERDRAVALAEQLLKRLETR